MNSYSTIVKSNKPANRLLPAIAAVTCVEFFENGLVTFSAGQIIKGLGLSPEQFAFAFTLYGVAAIFMLYKHQWMVERLGYRNFVLGSLALLSFGSILCGTANGLTQFAFGRILQGLGGATFFTAGRMAINLLPANLRFQGQRVFVCSFLGSTALTPVLATLLCSTFGWRSIFFCILPLSIGVAWLSANQLSKAITPPFKRSEEHWGWLLLMGLGVFGLLYSIQEISLGTVSATYEVLILGSLSIVILSAFAWRQWCKDRPLIDYRSLFQARYLLGILFHFVGYFMIGATGFILPIFVEHGLGLSQWESAKLVTLLLIFNMLSALLHLILMHRWAKTKTYMLIGLFCFMLGNFMLSRISYGSGWPSLLVPIMLCGISIPFFLGTSAANTFQELQPSVFSHGYQVKNILRQLGLSSSVALSTIAMRVTYGEQVAAAIPASSYPVWDDVLKNGQGNMGQTLVATCGEVYFLLGLVILPVAIAAAIQRVFR